MKTIHIVPGTGDVANGMAVVAKLLAKEQGEAKVVDLNDAMPHLSDVDEVWVHGMWLPTEWRVCMAALKAGKRLVRMTHGALSPVYLKNQSPLKKRLVSPIEKWLFGKTSRIVATCEAEKVWIEQYLCRRCPPVEVTDIKRFFNLDGKKCKEVKEHGPLHLLYLGRRHPLKGLAYLEEAIKGVAGVVLRAVDNAFGEEKEKVWNWCDILVLPTMSENFGLVVAEALERGKRVITTDGAPAWSGENTYGGRLVYLKGYRDGSTEYRVRLLKKAIDGVTCQS